MNDLEKVQQDRRPLKYIKDQTNEICLAAVELDGYALEYVRHQTEEICLTAIKQNGYTLQFVQNQTEVICLMAVKENYYALRYVQLPYFKSAEKALRLRALFDPELENYIKTIKKRCE